MENLAETPSEYDSILTNVAQILEQARRLSARSVNSIMTATYWEIGRQIVEVEQNGDNRAGYGEELLKHLAKDLTDKFGRGFSARNLRSFRLFCLTYQMRLSEKFEGSLKAINIKAWGEALRNPRLIRRGNPTLKESNTNIEGVTPSASGASFSLTWGVADKTSLHPRL